MSILAVDWRQQILGRKPNIRLLVVRLLPFLKPHRKALFAVFCCGILAAGAELLTIGLLIPLLQAIAGRESSTLFEGTPMQIVASLIAPLSVESRIRWLVAGMFLLQAVRETIVYAHLWVSARVYTRLALEIRRATFVRMIGVDMLAFERTPLANQYTMLNAFSQTAADVAFALLKMTVPALAIVIYSVLLLYFSVPLTLLACTSVGAIMWVSSRVIAIQQRHQTRLAGEATELNDTAFQIVSAMRTIRLFGREKFAWDWHDRVSRQYWAANFRSSKWASFVSPVNQVLGAFVVMIVFIVGTYTFSFSGESWIELVLVYLFIMSRLAAPASQINSLRGDLAARVAAADIVAEYLAETKPKRIEDPAPPMSTFGELRFDAVWFRYAENEPDVLREMSFSIPKGKVTAIVGPSGAGKSTIADLIARMYAPSRGRILLDDRPIDAISETQWRAGVAVVTQNAFLFPTSIKENVRFGRLDATDAEVAEAVRLANLEDVVADLPQGLETWVGERGVRLSGGQAQRVAIARAMLADPALLVLDEATSAQDSISEQSIQAAIEKLARNRTVVVIAHRLATVREADQILVLDKGALVERGTHVELIEAGGLYAQLVAHQDLR